MKESQGAQSYPSKLVTRMYPAQNRHSKEKYAKQ